MQATMCELAVFHDQVKRVCATVAQQVSLRGPAGAGRKTIEQLQRDIVSAILSLTFDLEEVVLSESGVLESEEPVHVPFRIVAGAQTPREKCRITTHKDPVWGPANAAV